MCPSCPSTRVYTSTHGGCCVPRQPGTVSRGSSRAGMSCRDGWTDGSALHGGFLGRAGLAVGACVSCACRSGSRAKSVRDLVEISKFLFREAKSLEISFTLGGPQISKRISRDPGISQRSRQSVTHRLRSLSVDAAAAHDARPALLPQPPIHESAATKSP